MPSRYQVIISRAAKRHLRDIEAFIEDRSPGNAAGMIQRIVNAIDGLQYLPYRYQLLSGIDTGGRAVRSVIATPYLIRYVINDVNLKVTIVSIRHGARKLGL